MSMIDIHLEVFEGPLDLLLYLVKKNNMDIYDIKISEITSEYLSYLDVMKDLNLEIAGEFLVMASTLMQIKSKMLLPKQPSQQEMDDYQDPRAMLIEQLEEYQKFKTASKVLEERFVKYRDVFYRGSPVFSVEDKVLDVEFAAIIEAVKRAFERLPDRQEISGEDFPIESRMEKIMNLLTLKQWLILDEVFENETKKLAIITCFLAILELIKQRKIIVSQDGAFKEVRIYARKELEN